MTGEQLAELLGSHARLAVLRVFMLDPGRAYYQRQLELAAAQPIRAVQRELDRLAGIGLLWRRDEGNRAYYQADTEHALFAELRALVLKAASPEDRLRAMLAAEDAVRLAFRDADCARVLVVLQPGRQAVLPPAGGVEFVECTSDAFADAAASRADWLDPFLASGADLLGRREDVMWRRIEAAGYAVPKGAGVP